MSRLATSNGDTRYRLDGQPVRSVTTMLNVLAKPQLVHWAAREAANYAADHWDTLSAMQVSERQALIAGAANKTRNRAAAKGTQMHAWAECLISGQPVEIPMEHVETVSALARWWETSGFRAVQVETAVWSAADDGLPAYAGRYDVLAHHPDYGHTLLDWKTGKGIYSAFAVQLAGYAAADWQVINDADVPNVFVQTLACVHIQPDAPTLYVLDAEQRDEAHARWELVRALNGHDEPKWSQKA